jgi:hypothetical protein
MSCYTTATFNTSTYGSSGVKADVSLKLTMVPVGLKNSTLLLEPTSNGTLTGNLPWGLKRYTGEGAFDLIEVNQTTSATIPSATIPFAQNSSDHYSLGLASGVTNILVPRSQFLYSPLGEALMLGNNTSWTNSSLTAPLLGPLEESTISGYGGYSTNPLRDLACYWQNRAISSGGTSGSICTESGTPLTSTSNLAIVTDKNSSIGDSGGLTGDPSLENGTIAGAAVQSIVTLNVSSNTTWDLLLASLLDNSSGGVNGTLFSVTTELQSLGLSQAVMQALSNASYSSSGLFGIPVSSAPPISPPPCNSIWCWGSNLAVGIVIVSGTLFSYAWNSAVATYQFVDDHIPTWLKDFGASLLSRAVGAITSAGRAITRLLNELYLLIKAEVVALLTPLIQPLIDADSAFVGGLLSALNATSADVYNGGLDNGAVTTPHAVAFLSFLSGTPVVAAIAIGVAIAIALTLVCAVGFGAATIATLVLGFFVLGAQELVGGLSGTALLTESAIDSVDSFFTGLYSENAGAIAQANWGGIAQSVGIAAGLEDMSLIYYLAAKQPEDAGCEYDEEGYFGCAATMTEISLVLAFFAFLIETAAASFESIPGSLIAAVLGTFATLTSVLAYKEAVGDSGLETFALVDVLASGIATGTAYAEMIHEVA